MKASPVVLIADDEPLLTELLEFRLGTRGYETVVAHDGREALNKLEQERPHAVVLDMMMPRKTGMEVCELLRAQSQFKETLIMFLTAINDEPTQLKGFDTGADDYVSKPVSTSVFVSKVNALFRRLKPIEGRPRQARK